MTLDKARKGQVVRITSIDNEKAKTQAVRMGICEGEVVTCREIIPAGPVVICKCRQEVAIGRRLAREIGIEPVALPLGESCTGCKCRKRRARQKGNRANAPVL